MFALLAKLLGRVSGPRVAMLTGPIDLLKNRAGAELRHVKLGTVI